MKTLCRRVYGWGLGLGFVFGLASLTPVSLAQAPIGSRDLARLGFTKHWELQLEIERGIAAQAYLLDDTLYVVTDEGDVHAVHAEVGLSRWSQNLTTGVYAIYPPSHFFAGDETPLVVFATGPRTVILDRYAGDIVADMPLDKAIASSAVADSENIYFGSSDGHFYAMIWADARSSTAVFRWRVIAGGPVTAAPVLVNGGADLVFASQGGSVFNCTSGLKMLNWSYNTEGAVISDIVAGPGGTYVASTDRSVYRLDTTSGALRWRSRFQDPLRDAPMVSGRTVLQRTPNEGVVALDAENGQRLWSRKEADGFLCRNLDQFVLTSGRTVLQTVDAETGKIASTVKLSGPVIAVPNLRDSTVYLVTPRGGIVCAKPVGTARLTPADVALARRGLHRAVRDDKSDAVSEPKRRDAIEDAVVDMDDPLRSSSKLPPLGGGS